MRVKLTSNKRTPDWNENKNMNQNNARLPPAEICCDFSFYDPNKLNLSIQRLASLLHLTEHLINFILLIEKLYSIFFNFIRIAFWRRQSEHAREERRKRDSTTRISMKILHIFCTRFVVTLSFSISFFSSQRAWFHRAHCTSHPSLWWLERASGRVHGPKLMSRTELKTNFSCFN